MRVSVAAAFASVRSRDSVKAFRIRIRITDRDYKSGRPGGVCSDRNNLSFRAKQDQSSEGHRPVVFMAASFSHLRAIQARKEAGAGRAAFVEADASARSLYERLYSVEVPFKPITETSSNIIKSSCT